MTTMRTTTNLSLDHVHALALEVIPRDHRGHFPHFHDRHFFHIVNHFFHRDFLWDHLHLVDPLELFLVLCWDLLLRRDL